MLKLCYLKKIIQTSYFYGDQCKILVHTDEQITEGRVEDWDLVYPQGQNNTVRESKLTNVFLVCLLDLNIIYFLLNAPYFTTLFPPCLGFLGFVVIITTNTKNPN